MEKKELVKTILLKNFGGKIFNPKIIGQKENWLKKIQAKKKLVREKFGLKPFSPKKSLVRKRGLGWLAG